MAVGSPLGYPYEPRCGAYALMYDSIRCGVYHQGATNYAAVFIGIHALEKPPGCRLEERNRVSKRLVKNQLTACSIG